MSMIYGISGTSMWQWWKEKQIGVSCTRKGFFNKQWVIMYTWEGKKVFCWTTLPKNFMYICTKTTSLEFSKILIVR